MSATTADMWSTWNNELDMFQQKENVDKNDTVNGVCDTNINVHVAKGDNELNVGDLRVTSTANNDEGTLMIEPSKYMYTAAIVVLIGVIVILCTCAPDCVMTRDVSALRHRGIVASRVLIIALVAAMIVVAFPIGMRTILKGRAIGRGGP